MLDITISDTTTLVFLIDVLSWINVLGGNFLQFNKRPALNKRPGKTFLHFEPCFCNIFNLFWWFPARIELISWNFSKINYRPVLNKDVLGGKMLKNNKNVLDFYSEHQSSFRKVCKQLCEKNLICAFLEISRLYNFSILWRL